MSGQMIVVILSIIGGIYVSRETGLEGRIDDMTVTMTAKCRASIISKTFSMQNVAMSEILDNFGVTIDNVKRLSELL